MSRVLIEEQILYDIGNAIRAKNGLTATYKPGEMSSTIMNSLASNTYNKLECYSYDGTTKLLDDLYVPSVSTYSPKFDYALEPSGVITSEPIQSVISNYTFYVPIDPSWDLGTLVESSDGTLSVSIFNDYIVWFFNGYTFPNTGKISSSDIDSNLSQYIPSSNNIMTRGYTDDLSTNIVGNVGTWNGGFRLLSGDNSTYIGGTVYATLEVPCQPHTDSRTIGGADVQVALYSSPARYYSIAIAKYISW